jgi:uncharacterized lipoprotein YmbA
LKKRTKKLLDLGADSPASVHAKDQKSFASFLQKRRPFFYLTAASLITLTSCASPNPDFYTLQPVSGAVIAAPAQSIELRRPGLAGYLDRSDVVLKSADYHINVNSQSRWAEPMGDMIGRVLAEDLSQRLPASSVFNESGAITADPSLRVEIDVQRFDLGADGQVTLTAETALESGRGHLPLKTHHIMLQAAPVGPGPANLAATMSSLLGQLADRVAQDVGAISP